jgi:hypothetical protein
VGLKMRKMVKKKIAGVCLCLILGLLFIITESKIFLALLSFLLMIIVIEVIRIGLLKKKCSFQLLMQTSGQKKEILKGKLIVHNNSIFPVIDAYCKLHVKNVLTNKGYAINVPFALKAKHSEEFPLEIISEHCGGLRITVDQVNYLDFSRSFKTTKIIGTSIKSTIFPNMITENNRWDFSARMNQDSTVYSEYKSGHDPGEIIGHKEYSPGDNIRYIHWKLTAKIDKTMVKELGFPVDDTFVLFYETKLPHENITPDTLDDYAAQFASIALYLVEQRVLYTIAFYNSEKKSCEFHKVGSEQELYNIFTDLFDQVRVVDDKSSLNDCLFEEEQFGVLYYFALDEVVIPNTINHEVVVIPYLTKGIENEE